MRKKQIYKKKKYSLLFWLCLLGTVWSLWGCGKDKEAFSEIEEEPLPSLRDILREDEVIPDQSDVSDNKFPPVRVYFDNTGSMEGFTINSQGKRTPCEDYVKLMRCLRDMGRVRETQYYILDVDLQDWALSETGIYDHFAQSDFHVWWASGQPGPLSKLYMENRIDESCISIVLTDLSEQNFNTTQMAEQIRVLCDQKGCEADLFAFKFDFHGVTQVPDPKAVSGMLEGSVNGKRPYYMVVTGPSKYVEKYVEELKDILSGDGLDEDVEYFSVTSRSDLEYESIHLSDVNFEPFADYDDIYEEINKESEEKGGEEEENESDKADVEIENLSRNLQRYENTDGLFEDGEETDLPAFCYQKVRGVGLDDGDWRLNFYIPLNDWDKSRKNYIYQYSTYQLENAEMGLTDQEQQAEAVQSSWIEKANSQIDISMEIYNNYKSPEREYPAVLYVSVKNKNALQKVKPEWREVLLVLDIVQEDIFRPKRPEWLSEFDSGDTGDLFTHTYGLNNFYNVLFGYEDYIEKDGLVHIKNNYIQIPILLTGLDKQEVRR